ncbi:aldo/keto reductase ferredoxin [[Clostridium] sordellii]|uniref:Aldo/keto reductase putative ferredoxin n=1 Tax=Paraclostridium sordellii TaxID=1505 RepID=A0ABP1XZ21_PARSO|nr:aldo/keto reductase [Paeniclostridium sordellii]CEJ75052.1 putative aldo/keto reductase; putative ferredoxin [[Clostridium] sordellii] [Paeniclostridium sordellii]CEN70820.1 aldo/keto reductase ferredoxin [[Clostridium] sordellii] [Paeniclostridium sordellii]CEN74038.1 aldo/keto reductase ferredoxin [[Clostridium] sordellii] [Paeniclostridium sordellii]CEO29750.1 aldo/keto reductase ferredoxin [[Clostridium] sordellii] [Paeniclostridium sordellii]CEP65618.1 aldo/keto reductase ferredoxin [[
MRVLGKTNLKINRIGFGGIPIQRVTQQDTNKIIDELINQGINFIDSARGYTVSEEYIGNAIEGKRDKFILASKSMSRTYEDMLKDVDITLKNFKTDYIDLYQLHNVKSDEYENIFNDNMAYKALLDCKSQGKIKNIGITSHSIDTIKKAVRDEKFDTIQFPYNIVEDQADEIFREAHKRNIGTIVMKPLAGGAINNAKLAIKYILSKEYIDVAIPGMDSVDQVLENISVLENLDIDKEDELKIEDIRSQLGNRFCRRCEYCMPCPVGINIPMNFLLEGYYSRYNLKEWSKERYNSLDIKASDCVECGKCESKCPYDLPIREMLKEVTEKLD